MSYNLSGVPPSCPPPPPPVGGPPLPPMFSQFPPVPPPFYTWGPPAPSPTHHLPPAPAPVQAPDLKMTQRNLVPSISSPAVVPPVRPGKDGDWTQHALDTVVAAAGVAATNARVANPEIRETPHIRTGLAGVKRKGLATELLSVKADSYHICWTRLWDTQMPAQLMAKCKPLHCELCGCQATSPVQAKMHYEGKNHDKNVRSFFASWSGNTGKIIPQKIVPLEKRIKESQAIRTTQLSCDLCVLNFTSQSQMDQHMDGKNHLKKLTIESGNSNNFNSQKQESNWDSHPDSYSGALNIDSKSSQVDSNFNKFFCDLCKVGAPSQQQMDMHLNGKNHMAKMKKSMGGVSNDDLDTISKRIKLKGNILAAVSKPKPIFNSGKKRTDYSVFRTPSGQYYCAACNISLNSENQFAQHQMSKKHRQKATTHKNKF